MMSESSVQQRIRLAAARLATTLWRNNSGALEDKDGRQVRFGLGNDSAKINKVYKSADLIGITPVTITPEHVGMTMGVFTAVECKPEGWKFTATEREYAQLRFLTDVRLHGGKAGFATSVEDYRSIIK